MTVVHVEDETHGSIWITFCGHNVLGQRNHMMIVMGWIGSKIHIIYLLI